MSKRVLIVDDEKNILVSLNFMMEQAGCVVETAQDGMTALHMIETDPPDLLLLDIMLPQMDGFELCKRLRGNHRFDDMKIILLTAKGRDVDVGKGLKLGADAYITKPFSTRDLMSQVNELLLDDTHTLS